jgi:diguanylate cyclase (GGDEF)-like protein
MADILRQTFRESDIIARLGGDEFIVFAAGTSLEQLGAVTHRLEGNLQSYNARGNRKYELSLSFGVVCVEPDNVSSIDELIVMADQAMYEHKRSRNKSRS